MYKIMKVAWEISNTVWNGLLKYCISNLFLSKLQLCLLKTNPALIRMFNCMMGWQKTMMSAEVSLWNFDNAIVSRLEFKKLHRETFLWSGKWDLGWFLASWQYWKKWDSILSNSEGVFSLFLMAKKIIYSFLKYCSGKMIKI